MTKYNRIMLLAIGVLLFLACFPVDASGGRQQKEIRIVFRFDDPSATSCMEIEEKLIAAFRKHSMHCTFGVIPFVAGDCRDPEPQELFPLPPAKIKMLRQAAEEGVLEIALHGYSHQNKHLRVDEPWNYSEFVGLSYEEQLERIKQGKEFLEEKMETPVTIFIPPWNAYDSNTVRALEQLEFQRLSADLFGFAGSSNSLEFLPATCGLSNIEDAVEAARKARDPAPSVIILFHEYDFKEVDPLRGTVTYHDFLRMLTWLSAQKDIYVRSIAQVGDMGRDRYTENHARFPAARLLPTWFHRWPSLLFLSLYEARSAKIRCYMLVLLFYGSVLLACSTLSFMFGAIVFPRLYAISRFCLYLGLIILLCGSIYVFHDMKFGLKGLIGVVAVTGYCVGTYCAYSKTKANLTECRGKLI